MCIETVELIMIVWLNKVRHVSDFSPLLTVAERKWDYAWGI